MKNNEKPENLYILHKSKGCSAIEIKSIERKSIIFGSFPL